MLRITLIAFSVLVCAFSAEAQNFTSPGQGWSGSWGFASASDRSISIQQAQAIRAAKIAAGPTSVNNITNYNSYDNRANYQQIEGNMGGLGAIDFHTNGDQIGQNTNSVGAMNTGTTNIDITGNANSVNATNAADSQGCVDGGIMELSSMNSGFEGIQGLTLGPIGFDVGRDCKR